MKKILFTLLFNAGEMNYNFLAGVFGVTQPRLKKTKQTKRERYRDNHVRGSNAGIIEKVLHYINVIREQNFAF